MTTSFQPRKPAGSPQGGQFDTKPHDQIEGDPLNAPYDMYDHGTATYTEPPYVSASGGNLGLSFGVKFIPLPDLDQEATHEHADQARELSYAFDTDHATKTGDNSGVITYTSEATDAHYTIAYDPEGVDLTIRDDGYAEEHHIRINGDPETIIRSMEDVTSTYADNLDEWSSEYDDQESYEQAAYRNSVLGGSGF